MTRPRWVKRGVIAAGAILAAVVLALLLWKTSLGQAVTWQRQASPGRLSAAHAFLEDNCAACHTAGTGPEAVNCIACHANDSALLQRQPTAFHAGIGSCRECHPEHQGVSVRPTAMDHVTLAKVGLRQLRDEGQADRAGATASWIKKEDAAGGLPHITAAEAALNCAGCHGTKDKHVGLFGQDCAQCHRTTTWTILEYRHPSPRSTDCAQCHQAPPSHYMGHFHMVSMKVAGKPHAQVNQCFLCHETTSWNDIKGVGWYKHH
jgi:hypothetical protein